MERCTPTNFDISSERTATRLDATVAICTWNRAELLSEALETLCAVRIPVGIRWECIVVNNACTDRTDKVLASFAERLPLRRLYEPVAGLARARNCAAREARGELLLFIDDDIRVEFEWLAAYLGAMVRWPTAKYFGGIIEPLFSREPPDFVTYNPETFEGILGMRNLGAVERPFRDGEGPYGGNMALRRSVFEQWTFDERLGHRHADRIAGEETQLFDNLMKNGQSGVWIPDARVKHVIAPELLTATELRRHFIAFGRSLVRRGDTQRTWILRYPRWICRAYCLITLARVTIRSRLGRTNWAPLLARCATWEGILDEACQGTNSE